MISGGRLYGTSNGLESPAPWRSRWWVTKQRPSTHRYAIVDEAMMREGAEKLARYESGNGLESMGKVIEQGKDLGKVTLNPSLQEGNPASNSLDSMVGGTGIEPVTSAV